MANLKLTGFGRLIIFLLIVAPIAYFGIQYLQKSGTLDSLKEKVENKADNQTATPEQETSEDILREIDRRSSAGNEQESIIAEQQRKIEELERQNQELQKRKEGGSSTISIPPKTTSPSLPPPPPSNNAPSLDDLIRQAENKTGRTTTSSEPSLPSPKESLASWDFSFSNVSGQIEFYQQGSKLMSRVVYREMNREDVHELISRNDRYYVQGSPTGEYYVVRSDGNLDAYDENGFQTTCKRR